MTKTLSPAAQAVDDAFWKTIKDKWNIYDRRRSQLAAALRALNEYVVLPKYQYAEWELANAIHQEIEAVADELEDT